MSCIHLGLVLGGGVGDTLDGETINGPYAKYWAIYAYTIIWFIVINIMCINMTMGIIIDSFG